jgi:type I restriction enzyme M protein
MEQPSHVALPLNMFYNTGIATYFWALSNRKPEHRRGKVQFIGATQWFKPLRKNLGKKNCELSEEDIQRICDTFLAFEENEQSKIFPNAAFGYWKVPVERPLRLTGIDPSRAFAPKEIKAFVGAGFKPALNAPPVIRTIHEKGSNLCALEEIRSDILALEKETEGLLDEIIGIAPSDASRKGCL